MDMSKTKTKALGYAVALCGAMAAQAASAGSVPDALDDAPNMAVVVFEGAPGSAAILDGDFSLGLQQAEAAYERAPGRNVVQLATSLCVANMKLGNLEAARSHCDRAMAGRVPAGAAPGKASEYRAVALVNRGVLRTVEGAVDEAGADFHQASHTFPDLGVARSNLLRVREIGAEPTATTESTL